ncbi:acetate uptake transporter [Fusibacter ferrireducens]|uniref:Acetate uptake transporter n=1 Tax=Fusibacter ferrireducens TaxID=2785058 RepID=A0ABR9ZS90_9FIRM|nr:acetate uptake transporter [Fusibacter ferrireducens]MBF4692988.1 acetate uptake transporter [Fusibacter ferrireducens]
MNQNERKIFTADPSALGLFGLAMITFVASTQKLGWTTGTSFIIPWAIFLGACAQIYACVNDAKKGNVFGATAFGAYSFFWLAVAMSWMISNGVFGSTMAQSADSKQLGFAFLGYLIFSVFMTIGSLETNKVLMIIFVLIDFLFLGLSMSVIWGIEIGHEIAAWSEFFISLVGFYGSGANVLNHTFGREFLPVGKPLGIFKK